jgi:valyl-tRNA synthetase
MTVEPAQSNRSMSSGRVNIEMEISGAQPLRVVTQQPPTSTPSISQVVVQSAPLMPHSRAMGFSQGKTVQLATPMIAAYSSKDHEQQQANTEPTNVSELVSMFNSLFKQEVSTIQVHKFEQELQRLASEFDASRTQLDAEAFCSRSDNNLVSHQKPICKFITIQESQ